jgi:hypothetical protein
VGPNILHTFPVGFASQPFRDVPFKEACQGLHTALTALHFGIIWESQRILGDAVRQIPVGAPPEGPSAEGKLVGANSERPPVDRV